MNSEILPYVRSVSRTKLEMLSLQPAVPMHYISLLCEDCDIPRGDEPRTKSINSPLIALTFRGDLCDCAGAGKTHSFSVNHTDHAEHAEPDGQQEEKRAVLSRTDLDPITANLTQLHGSCVNHYINDGGGRVAVYSDFPK